MLQRLICRLWWRCGFGISGIDMCWRYATADTATLAICRVALEAVAAGGASGEDVR